MSKPPLRIGVLISGAGSTLANLIARIGDGRLRGVEIATVISTRSNVKGNEIALAAGLPLEIVRLKDFSDAQEFSATLGRVLHAAQAELVVMAGFLCYWHIPPRYRNRVINIHPALLPAHGGRGMHGLSVHEAVLKSGARESGCTVHVADDEYDHGPILAQRRVPVLAGDTPETLAARVAVSEREVYPEVIAEIAARGVEWLATKRV